MKKSNLNQIRIGWQEWCALPELSIPAIKAKIDTGAKTSSIHAINIEQVRRSGKEVVCFDVYPLQNNDDVVRKCESELIDIRSVMSSNGIKEKRYVIQTTLNLGTQSWSIEVTLSNREPLKFRMLLGREALGSHVLIDPHLVCRQGRIKREQAVEMYANNSLIQK